MRPGTGLEVPHFTLTSTTDSCLLPVFKKGDIWGSTTQLKGDFKNKERNPGGLFTEVYKAIGLSNYYCSVFVRVDN